MSAGKGDADLFMRCIAVCFPDMDKKTKNGFITEYVKWLEDEMIRGGMLDKDWRKKINQTMTTNTVFEHDFGAIAISREVGAIVEQYRTEAAGDGRRKSVREARRKISAIESALLCLTELAHRAGVHPSKIITGPQP